MSKIENARDFMSAIEIISEENCDVGLYFLQSTLLRKFASKNKFSFVPIAEGGNRVGKVLSHPKYGIYYELNPMQMSNYGPNNNRLEHPRLIKLPNINKIVVGNGHTTRDVVFAEAVVDSQGTILSAMDEINTAIDDLNHKKRKHYPYPVYHTITLVSKINGATLIPNLIYAYHVDSRIWVHGWGCDSKKKGRKENRIMGYLPIEEKSIPELPYYFANPELFASLLG